MKIERIVLRQIRIPLVHFFETSFSRTYERNIIIVEVLSEGLSGWGEITAGEHPFYNEEWTAAAWLIAKDYVAPRLLNLEIEAASDVNALTRHIRGHNMARGGVEAAVWDLQARRNGNPLWKEIGGGARREIPCGVSIGIQNSVEELIGKIETELAAGYQRIKMKIKPGWDVDVIRRIRERFPATSPPVSAIGNATSSCRACKPLLMERSRSPTTPDSGTRLITTSCGTPPYGKKRSPPPRGHERSHGTG